MDTRQAIAKRGGLVSRAGLAKRWSVSKAYVSQAVQHRDFPTPIYVDDTREVWFGDEVDAWRAAPRKPGPVPKSGTPA